MSPISGFKSTSTKYALWNANDINDLLKSNIDALVIATPAITHEEIVRKGLNSNKHIFA